MIKGKSHTKKPSLIRRSIKTMWRKFWNKINYHFMRCLFQEKPPLKKYSETFQSLLKKITKEEGFGLKIKLSVVLNWRWPWKNLVYQWVRLFMSNIPITITNGLLINKEQVPFLVKKLLVLLHQQIGTIWQEEMEKTWKLLDFIILEIVSTL